MQPIDTRSTAGQPAPADLPVAPAVSPELAREAGQAAERFEGFFIAQMLRQMRSMSNQISEGEGASRDKVHDDMLEMADTLVADAMAGQRAFGIADLILRQVLPAPAASTPAALNAAPMPVAKSGNTIASTP
jgi:peptidoglycan hydrolase FlgJ